MIVSLDKTRGTKFVYICSEDEFFLGKANSGNFRIFSFEVEILLEIMCFSLIFNFQGGFEAVAFLVFH
jgi:hypothetical protein